MGSTTSDSLSQALLALLDVVPDSISKDVISKYHQKIQSQAELMDAIHAQEDYDTAGSPVTLAAKASQILFDARAITSKDPSYQSNVQVNWSVACWLPAKCIAKLHNSIETALALKIITHFQCPFAVRSGGHLPNPGFGSIGESGILLDLGSMNSVILSNDHLIASIGPGAKWGRVYEVLQKEGLNVVGGRVAEVGVAGLTIGGGMSHFSNHWGMVCDNVENFEVVLSDSTVVQANSNNNTALYRALKGGGPNFGIVTRFDLRTNLDYLLWYSMKVYSSSDVKAVMEAAVSLEDAMQHDSRIGFFLTCQSDSFVAGMLYVGDKPAPGVFDAFDAITPLAVAVPETAGSQLSFAASIIMPGNVNWTAGTISVIPNVDLYRELHQVLRSTKFPPSCTFSFTFQPINASAVKHGQTKGGNSMDVPPQQQSWIGLGAQFPSTSPEEDLQVQGVVEEVLSRLRQTAQEKQLLLNHHFMNDSWYFQSPLASLEPDTFKFLEQVSEKYDPQGVMQNCRTAGFFFRELD